jgi:hypothetical protein
LIEIQHRPGALFARARTRCIDALEAVSGTLDLGACAKEHRARSDRADTVDGAQVTFQYKPAMCKQTTSHLSDERPAFAQATGSHCDVDDPG